MRRNSFYVIVFLILLAGVALAADKNTGTSGGTELGYPAQVQSSLVQGNANRAVTCVLLSNYSGDLSATKAFFEANMTDISFDTFDTASGVPSVSYLEGFDCVLLMENGLTSNGPAVGAVIYDYVMNSMGNVVYGTFIWQNWTTWGGNGWGAMEGICPLYETGGCTYTYDSLDMSTVVSHPVTDGVTGLFGSYRGGSSVNTAAVGLGDWSDGTDAISIDDTTGGRQCAINIFPAYEAWGVYGTDFGGDFYLLFENAIKWCASGQGNPYPRLDVDCNGDDGPVEVFDGANCTVTIDVEARDFAGFPAEIWVIGVNKTSGGVFSYGAYPSAVWLPGVCNFYYGGGLMDMAETALDQPLPVGSYEIYLALELSVNGHLNLPFIWDYDMVAIDVIVPPTEYKWDSGTTDNLLCWTSGGDMVGMHCFDTIPGGEALANVGTIFGSSLYSNYAPGNGTPTDFYVWEATSFGDPTNATLLTQGTGVVGNVDLDLHYWDACPCTVTTPNFYVAYNLHHAAYEYCLSIDSTNPYVYGAAFYTGTNTMNGFDPANLYGNQYPPAESPYGFWTVRAEY